MTVQAERPRPAMPTNLYRAEQLRRLERAAIERHGIPGIDLMTRAGEAAYQVLRERWPAARNVLVLAGSGNNAGDGYVIARLAMSEGLAARVLYLSDPRRLKGDAAIALDAYLAAGGSVEPFVALPPETDVIVDALLGTGLERPVAGRWAEAVSAANASGLPILAVDIPSGLHSDTGEALGPAIQARATVTFIGHKQGLYLGAGPDCRGGLHFASLEVPEAVYLEEQPSLLRVDWQAERHLLGTRRRTAHKGDFGHVLIVGGAPGMAGAARLAGEAALRAGAGLVSVATHPSHAPFLNLTRPELMVSGVAEPDELAPLLNRADVVAIGPGLGRGEWGRALWTALRTLDLPTVADADALNLLAEAPDRRDGRILTPHPGEAARLMGVMTAELERDRASAAAELQGRYGGVIVLKGAGTLVRHAGGPAWICSDGNPGMATAGSGDVLTGIIAALVGQGLSMEAAARAGVCLHAAAGDLAARSGERGLVAGDIIKAIRPLANESGGVRGV